MSRNLGGTTCAFCDGEVKLAEPTRFIRREDCGIYFDEYAGMLVAEAECADCMAKYIAWVDERPRQKLYSWGPHPRTPADGPGFFDLSHRSTFNDEPGPLDMPTFRIEVQRVKVGPWPTCSTCGGPTQDENRCMDYDCSERADPQGGG